VELRRGVPFDGPGAIVLEPCGDPAPRGFGRMIAEARLDAWETLRTLAEGRGVMSAAATATDWRKVEKHIQEIRGRLRAHFGLAGDPVPYIDGAYRTRFTIGVSASYER
jgi:hypothetical protein